MDTQQVTLPGGALLPYQVEGLRGMYDFRGRTLLADDMGLGKTVQALAWAYFQPRLRPVLVVCPAAVKLQWQREAVRWLGLPPESVSVVKGTKGAPIPGVLAIINYEILKARYEDLRAFRPALLIFDECHALKESGRQRSMFAGLLASFPSVRSVLGLTGTPVMNRPKEVWHQAKVINPAVFPDWWSFAQRYCNPERVRTKVKRDKEKKVILGADGEPEWNYSWDFSGASHTDELDRRLRGSIMIRRKKEDVLPDLPEYRTVTVPFQCDLRTYLPVRETTRERLAALRDQWRQERRNVTSLPEPEQAVAMAKRAETNSTVKLYGYMIQEITALKQEAAMAKVGPLIEWVGEFIEAETPLVLATYHKAVAAALVEGVNLKYEKVIDEPIPMPLDGSMSQKRRQEHALAFAEGRYPLLACGITAMGEGVDGLQRRASHLAFCELGWNPTTHAQMASRLHRLGQANAVTGYYLLAADTIEEDIAGLVDSKGTVTSAVVGELDDIGIFEAIVDTILEE